MRQEEIEGRIQNLEVGMQSVILRLQALEAKPANAPQPEREKIVPPPIIDTKPSAPRPQEPLRPQPPKVQVHIPSYMHSEAAILAEPNRQDQDPYHGFGSRTPYSNPQSVSDPDEMEYKFGINGLLRGGAAVVLVAVLFLVAQALSRGWITPTMQFIGEILLCFGFIGLGVWKQDEREDFGKLMVGIGSFGLYASFAGAYAYKHLFEGEVLVGLYMLLSLANLGFSHWRASKSFLCVGLLGGLVAAAMPMREHKVVLDFALHFAILIPCAAIIVRNKWNGMGALMWGVSTLALIPAISSDFLFPYRVGAIYLNCAIALYATGKVFKESDFDGHAVMQAVMLFVSGCLAVGIDRGHNGSLHALVLTTIGGGVAYLLRDNVQARNSTLFGSLAVLVVITPMRFDQVTQNISYAVEALILAGLALRFQYIALNVIGLTSLLFSFGTYVYNPSKIALALPHYNGFIENLVLLVYTATVVLNVAYALRRPEKEIGEMSLFLGASLIVAFFIRSLNIFLGNGNTPLRPEDISSMGVAIASLAALTMASRMKRTGLFVASTLLGGGTCVIALLHEPDAFPLWMSPSLLLMATGTVILACRYILDNEDVSYQEPTLVFAGLVLSSFFLRLLGVAGASHLLGLDQTTVIVLGIAILNLAWTGIAIWRRRSAYLILGWISLVVAGLSGPTMPVASGPTWLSPTVVLIPMVTAALMYWITPRKDADEPVLASLLAISEWALVSVLSVHHLTKWFDIKDVAGLTLGWVVLAVVFIVIGFKTSRRYIRYWSIGIFMITVGKVFLIDLATLDSFVRVSILMLLGLGMVGGGYWYILWRRSHVLPGDRP